MVHIDYRKLIAFSKGSFVVTMPKSWIEKHNLKKGDMISIEEGSDELVFYAGEKERKKEEKTITINAENKSLDRIKIEVVSAYLNNYNTIEIFSENLENDATIIKNIIRNLSGMEIIEQTGKRIVAKDLLDENSISIQSIIRRMDTITRSMIDDTILCIEGKCNPANIENRDVEVNRLYYLGFRAIKSAMENPELVTKLKTTYWGLSSERRILSRIEEIADRQKRISRLIAEVKFKDNALKEFKEINEAIKERYSEVMKAYYTNNKDIACGIEITTRNFIEKCDNFLKKISEEICLYCLQTSGSDTSLSLREKIDPENTTVYPRKIIVSGSKINENMKAIFTFIKLIARTVLNMDQ